MKNIVWLASFPRSGNTWLRYVICSLLDEVNEARIDTNPTLHCANRKAIEETLSFSVSLLSVEEVNNVRPAIYRQWSREWTQESPLLIKVHDCYATNKNGRHIFPSNVTQAAIYLVRNPLDICVSYAHFWGLDNYDEAADLLCNKTHSLPASNTDLFGQIYQHIADWSTNVDSWCNQSAIPVKVVKYEDMKHAPLDTFSSIVKYLNLPYAEDEIQAALQHCDISKLQQQEADIGFRDRPYGGDKFFRQGKTNTWRDKLAQSTADKIVNCHNVMMRQFGYLNDDGQPI
ncbi:sulfotransferase domain-containing protein [Alteromonas sp. a30]|uniref:sulfotransferase domain-containing protein n=1 Tax=Alteromonas sp. a30 TaxID=2730917 RepID=UPI002281F97F|nr:sulfotransferase domain-containing protein [Alteromonas sp. a30]MCY7296700.1 hypothetical protein [Alteromonas sp. a30]